MILLIVLGGFPAAALAREDWVPGSRYISARGAAMGDAFEPFADDGPSSLFYNPAGLGKIRQTRFEPLNFAASANTGYFGMIDSKFYDLTSLSSYAPTISGHSPARPGWSGELFPTFSMRGLSFGVLMSGESAAQGSAGNITYRSNYQFIPTAGGALRLAGGVLRLGYSVQWVNEAAGTVTVPVASAQGYNQGLAKGSGFSHTLGATLTLPVQLLPSFNVVARNVLGLKWGSSALLPLGAPNASGTLPDEPMTLDASFGMSPKIGRGATLNFAFEYRDATNRSNTVLMGRIATGVELAFRDAFFLRGGLGSGYPCAGFGLKRKTGELGLSWFSEEAGQGYHQLRDTKFLFHYQMWMF